MIVFFFILLNIVALNFVVSNLYAIQMVKVCCMLLKFIYVILIWVYLNLFLNEKYLSKKA